MARSVRVGAVGGLLALPVVGFAVFRWAWPPLFDLLALALACVLVMGGIAGHLCLKVPIIEARGVRGRLRSFTAFSAATGLGWGTIAASFLNDDPVRTAVLLCTVLLIQVSVTSANMAYLPVIYAFTGTTGVLFAAKGLASSLPVNMMMGAGVVVLMVVMLSNAHQAHRMLIESITTQFANAALNDALTEQRVQERTRVIEAASRHKSEFLATMSHELRTPLNAILGYSEMLQEDAADLGAGALVPDLKKIHGAGQHLLQMINGVLDLSKIEAGRMEVQLDDLVLAELLASVQAVAAPLAQKNGNRLVLTLQDGLAQGRADGGKLQQVLLNLLGNACKFTRNGEVRLTVSRAVAPAAGAGDWVQFAVADTGIGIRPEQMGRLFQDFSQADSGTARQFGGTGLGLALSRRLCRLMGGDIGVHSVPGQGSTFIATLPWPAAQVAATAPAGPLRGTVLVIDDDALVRELLARVLTREGYAVLQAADGAAGLALARTHRPDLITLDLVMPGLDGWQVMAALNGDAALTGIPVIILSMLDDHRSGYALGAAEVMTKPVDRERLLAALRHHHRARPVLVVDDDPMMRRLLRRQLEAEGHSVVEADGGDSALQLLVASDPAPGLILLDLVMPGMDGFEFLAALRLLPGGHDLPVVIVTAKDMSAEEREWLGGSVVRILQKRATGHDRLMQDVRQLVAASLGGGRPAEGVRP